MSRTQSDSRPANGWPARPPVDPRCVLVFAELRFRYQDNRGAGCGLLPVIHCSAIDLARIRRNSNRKSIARSVSQIDARDFDVLVAHVYRLDPIAVGQAHDLKMIDIGSHIREASGIRRRNTSSPPFPTISIANRQPVQADDGGPIMCFSPVRPIASSNKCCPSSCSRTSVSERSRLRSD